MFLGSVASQDKFSSQSHQRRASSARLFRYLCIPTQEPWIIGLISFQAIFLFATIALRQNTTASSILFGIAGETKLVRDCVPPKSPFIQNSQSNALDSESYRFIDRPNISIKNDHQT